MEDHMRDLKNNIQFYKNQILYYQSLLEDTVNVQNNFLNKSVSASPDKLVPKFLNKRQRKDKSENLLTNTHKLRLKMKQLKEKEKLNQKKRKINIGSDDNRRVRIKQCNARKALMDNDNEINKIRKMEQCLTEEGMTPEEARIKTRNKLYPSSLSNLSKDGNINRSHDLLGLRDSTDSENDVDDDADSDSDEYNTHDFLPKLNDLFKII